MSRDQLETIRRLRFGDLLKLCRSRYGHELPNDDAGRETIYDIVTIASLARVNPRKKMTYAAELWSPWLSDTGTTAMFDSVNRTPAPDRWGVTLGQGERQRLTWEEKERIGLRNTPPCDVTKEEMKVRRKIKERDRKRAMRALEGRVGRKEYEAKSDAKLKPWLAAGVSRRTWYRRKGP